MTYKEYKEKRESLFNEAQNLINEGKLDEAKAKKAEIESLDARFDEEKEARADLEALNNSVRTIPEDQRNEARLGAESGQAQQLGAGSVEYKNAWLKEMAKDDKGNYRFGAPTKLENDAFTFTTANTGAVVPTQIQDRIIELVDSYAPLYADATRTGMVSGFGIPRHKAIVQGDATVTGEGVANDDEQDTFDLLSLDGVEIKKHVDITRKMQFQSIKAFEDWITTHIAQRIGVAKDLRIIAQLGTTTHGIDTANVLTAQAYNDATIRKIMGMIHGMGAKSVYANSKTIWNGLAGIAEGDGTKAFVPNSMVDPVVAGRIYGANVVIDENLADNVAYFGIPARILANDFDTLTMMRDVNAKTFVTTISGYSLFDAGLEDPKAFVKVTFTAGN